MDAKLRVVIVDDERPARSFLAALLKSFDDVKIVGEAENGAQAIALIEKEQPDLALLDLQMPEIDGLEVVRQLKKSRMPLIAFVTAYDEHAVKAFELNAIDYLLKPVERARLQETINRAQERLDASDLRLEDNARLETALTDYAASVNQLYLERIPIRKRDEIIIMPVSQIAAIIADGELLHITSIQNERNIINYRLKELEMRLDPTRFVRLGRGSVVNIDAISRINQMPGGNYLVTLTNGQQIKVSRLQSRSLRERLLRL